MAPTNTEVLDPLAFSIGIPAKIVVTNRHNQTTQKALTIFEGIICGLE